MKKYVSVLALLLIMTLLCACGKQAVKPAFIPEGHEEDTVTEASFDVKDGEVLTGTFSLFADKSRLLTFTYTPEEGCVLKEDIAAPAGKTRTTKTTISQLAGAMESACGKVSSDYPDKTLYVAFVAIDRIFNHDSRSRDWCYSLKTGELRSLASNGITDTDDGYGLLTVVPGLDGSIVTFCLDE